MGLDIVCGDKSFSCSYSYWHKIRTNVIKASLDYIRDKFEKDKTIDNEGDNNKGDNNEGDNNEGDNNKGDNNEGDNNEGDNNEDKDNDTYIGVGSHYSCYMSDINYMIKIITEENNKNFYYVNMDIQLDNTMKIFMRLSSELKNILALNYFGLGGLFALCNQSDCEGYYTPGNSLDICLLFDKIKFFMKKYEGYNCIYNTNIVTVNTIHQIFDNSYKKLVNVSLC